MESDLWQMAAAASSGASGVDIVRYQALVTWWFQTIFYGWPARILAALALLLAFWRGIYHQQLILGALFFILCVLFTYTGSVVRVLAGL
ncbi:hypothetical protein [Nitrospira calida]|jgi:hypothetical protein